ncbi:MAG: hypothetical protein PHC28_05930 [Flavobacterium sp.]|uniref:hypothetical protein n=1 Tax=Flavobacterium sp. TaxID=239 RepID=UPI00260DE273|nr:hypothetical protein [Flavobacterium sp.]MDD5150008.1 hypothetical protein [Flavobacterium sp.]
MLTELEKLFIIACKSKTPMKNIIHLYQEHYYDTDDIDEVSNGLIAILGNICDKYFPIKNICNFIKELDPNKYKIYDGLFTYDFKNEVVNSLINQIRFSPTNMLVELTQRNIFD